MSFKRVYTMGFGGIVLLHLVACGSRAADERANLLDSNQQDERVNSNVVKSEESPSANEAVNCRNESGGINLQAIKWLNKLEKPPVYVPSEKDGLPYYAVTAKATDVQMLPDCLPKTRVLAFGGQVKQAGKEGSFEYYGSPGPTFEMTRGQKARVEWFNEIEGKHLFSLGTTPHPIENAETDVPFVTHVHGLEVSSKSDGFPNAWFTHSGKHGPDWDGNVYEYPNSQPATALWYHDHTIGMTRYNVYAGLAGAYLIRDPNTEPKGLVQDEDTQEMPLVLQDRSFKTDGSLNYTSSGNVNVVNGHVWPDMVVKPTRYRFRALNASNSRPFNLSLTSNQPFTVIGSDGGYLAAPISVTTLSLMNGERADILIDFATIKPDQDSHVFLNDGAGGQFVRFTIAGDGSTLPEPAPLPKELNKDLTPTTHRTGGSSDYAKRTVTLQMANDGTYLLNGQSWHGDLSEIPQVGATEDWEFVNLTGGTHPMHLHLVQFRIIDRQMFNKTGYQTAWTAQNGTLPLKTDRHTVSIDADAYVTGNAIDPLPAEAGWKDTVAVPPNQVTRIRVRWAPQDAQNPLPGKNPFDFDPTT